MILFVAYNDPNIGNDRIASTRQKVSITLLLRI
jgi:hypothetical protein